MARIYKRLPNNSTDQNDDIEAVRFTGNNIEEVAEFVGYVPEIIDKNKPVYKIVSPHGTFKLTMGQWIGKGEYQGNEIFYVIDNSTFVKRWECNRIGQ
jgi:hypothetical protein